MGHMLWKSIKGGWGVLYQHIGFMVDDGSKIRFWHDIWCVDTTLKDSFLVVYEQKASVAELLGVSEGSMQCNVNFHKQPKIGKFVYSLTSLIYYILRKLGM
ncbi:hypothetical protein I3842_13G178800 [Carya illinoinensis]|uniref:Uncharacterized protein n=1 Tax=Carya illinoinensis TaxID=32201 RepID=A0A922DF29_CARIL|nr:hypothetical protein I3842_13G178800 [Carya illinoinensis]